MYELYLKLITSFVVKRITIISIKTEAFPEKTRYLKHVQKKANNVLLSRLTVVSREAKKEQSETPKTKRATNYCVYFTRVNVFVI